MYWWFSHENFEAKKYSSFIDFSKSTSLCVCTATFENKYKLPCSSIHFLCDLPLWTGNILWSWSLLGAPGVFRGVSEPCTLWRANQINNWLQGTVLDAASEHVCWNKDNIPRVQVPGDCSSSATSEPSAIRRGLWCIIHTLLFWLYTRACEVHRVRDWRVLDVLMMKYCGE